MKKFLLSAVLFLAITTPVMAKVATCQIKTTDGSYNGKCIFSSESGGSFAVSHPSKRTILPDISIVSVTILEPGLADVRGLTTNGINSAWGEAHRSTTDKACWIGEDFKICAR